MRDYFGYKDKICVITGASSGIGKATAEMLVDLGAIVYLLDKNIIESDSATFIKVDLNNKESIDEAFSKLPEQIDKFFGVAGLSGISTKYYETFTVNYIANKYITENYLKTRMSKDGAIVFVTSTGGNHWLKYQKEYELFNKATTWEEMNNVLQYKAREDTIGMMAYPLSKRALNYYVASSAIELGKLGIRVNALLPGSTETGMKEEFEIAAGGKEALISHTGQAKRLATPEEMAEPLIFLNSDMARFISGEHLIVDYASTVMGKLNVVKDEMDRKVASPLFNTKMFQNMLKKRLEIPEEKEQKEKQDVNEKEILLEKDNKETKKLENTEIHDIKLVNTAIKEQTLEEEKALTKEEIKNTTINEPTIVNPIENEEKIIAEENKEEEEKILKEALNRITPTDNSESLLEHENTKKSETHESINIDDIIEDIKDDIIENSQQENNVTEDEEIL